MVAVVLDAQDCLSVDKYRQTLLAVLGKIIFPDARVELIKLRSTHAYLFKDLVKSKNNAGDIDLTPLRNGECIIN